ncbi:MAG: hypothetical protein LBU65_02055 [Planctomycetaceae bacterium]|nr:hypothetical protein [Planctomycetaceae bacterium]
MMKIFNQILVVAFIFISQFTVFGQNNDSVKNANDAEFDRLLRECIRTQKYEQALSYLKKDADKCKKNNDIIGLQAAVMLQSAIYELQGKYKEGVRLLNEFSDETTKYDTFPESMAILFPVLVCIRNEDYKGAAVLLDDSIDKIKSSVTAKLKTNEKLTDQLRMERLLLSLCYCYRMITNFIICDCDITSVSIGQVREDFNNCLIELRGSELDASTEDKIKDTIMPGIKAFEKMFGDKDNRIRFRIVPKKQPPMLEFGKTDNDKMTVHCPFGLSIVPVDDEYSQTAFARDAQQFIMRHAKDIYLSGSRRMILTEISSGEYPQKNPTGHVIIKKR